MEINFSNVRASFRHLSSWQRSLAITVGTELGSGSVPTVLALAVKSTYCLVQCLCILLASDASKMSALAVGLLVSSMILASSCCVGNVLQSSQHAVSPQMHTVPTIDQNPVLLWRARVRFQLGDTAVVLQTHTKHSVGSTLPGAPQNAWRAEEPYWC